MNFGVGLETAQYQRGQLFGQEVALAESNAALGAI
jgi:hypothetical protein